MVKNIFKSIGKALKKTAVAGAIAGSLILPQYSRADEAPRAPAKPMIIDTSDLAGKEEDDWWFTEKLLGLRRAQDGNPIAEEDRDALNDNLANEDVTAKDNEAVGNNWAAEPRQKQKPIIETNFASGIGYIKNTLMGKDFAEGVYGELRAGMSLNFSEKSAISLDNKLKFENMGFARGAGSDGIDNLNLESVLLLGEKDRRWWSGSANITMAIGGNFSVYNSRQTFEGVPIVIRNINAGPALEMKIDSKYACFSMLTLVGFGKAGNTVHGKGDVIKIKERIGLGIKIPYATISGYGEGTANIFSIKNVSRGDYTLGAGAALSIHLNEMAAIELGYDHIWVFGNLDNIESNIFKGGLELKF